MTNFFLKHQTSVKYFSETLSNENICKYKIIFCHGFKRNPVTRTSHRLVNNKKNLKHTSAVLNIHSVVLNS